MRISRKENMDNNIPDHLKDDPSAPYNIDTEINYPEHDDSDDVLEDDGLWETDEFPQDYDI